MFYSFNRYILICKFLSQMVSTLVTSELQIGSDKKKQEAVSARGGTSGVRSINDCCKQQMGKDTINNQLAAAMEMASSNTTAKPALTVATATADAAVTMPDFCLING